MRDMIQWVFLVAYVFFVAALLTFPFRRKNTPFWKDFVIAVPIAAIGLVSMVALRSFIDNATDWVFRLHGGNLILGTVAIGLGVTIFVFKKKSQLWYGVLELIFGAFSASAVASGMNTSGAMFSHWVALAGSVYVVARGLNNISDHIEEHGDRYGNKTLWRSFLALFCTSDTPKHSAGLDG